MNKFKTIVTLIALSASQIILAQTSIGLVCTSESESYQRHIKVKLSNSEVEVYDFGLSAWRPVYKINITTSEISFARIRDSSYQRLFAIDRLDGTWKSNTSEDFYDSSIEHRGICVSKNYTEMNNIAAQELARINERRAF